MLLGSRGKMFKKIVACALSLTMMLSIPVMQNTGVISGTTANAAIDKASYKTVKEAGVEARSKYYDHKSKVVLKVKSKSKEPQSLYESIEKVIYAETNNPNEGDYMRWDVDETEAEYSATKSGSYYYYTFTVSIDYLTTLKEREKLDKAVNDLIKGFKFKSSTSTYDKIKKVYDYVCKNVSYAKNSGDEKVYSAYYALIKKKAVCQGYASLLYKIYRTLGIPTRVIAGNSSFSGDNHGWNIVKLGSYFYNIDATWDSTLTHAGKSYNYFLKGDSFKGHTRWTEYATSNFYYLYPMAAKAYSTKTAAKASTKTKIAKFKKKKPKFKSITRKKATFKAIKKATYQIKYSTDRKFKKKLTKIANPKKAKYKFKKLTNGVIYFVKFRAKKKIGKAYYYTKWSAVKQI